MAPLTSTTSTTCTPSDLAIDTDTDSIGQQTSDEFADAQEKSQGDNRSHEGEGSNSNAGECLFSGPFPLTLTQSLDQPNELIPDLDQFGDDFNWDEDFGGDFEDGEYGESEDQSNVETKTVDPQEPVSGSSKRGFDEIDSDTVDEEQRPGDVSPSRFLSTPAYFRGSHEFPRLKTEEGAVVRTCAGWTPFERMCGPCTYFLLFILTHFRQQPTQGQVSLRARIISTYSLVELSVVECIRYETLADFDRFPSVGRGIEFLGIGWVEKNYGHAVTNRLSCIPYTTRYCNVSSAVNSSLSNRPIILPVCHHLRPDNARFSYRATQHRTNIHGVVPFPVATLPRIHGLFLKISQTRRPNTIQGHP